jgi:hypothetical protein
MERPVDYRVKDLDSIFPLPSYGSVYHQQNGDIEQVSLWELFQL